MKGRNRAEMMVFGLIDAFFFAHICTDIKKKTQLPPPPTTT